MDAEQNLQTEQLRLRPAAGRGRVQLVLDVAGVLVPNLTGYWARLDELAGAVAQVGEAESAGWSSPAGRVGALGLVEVADLGNSTNSEGAVDPAEPADSAEPARSAAAAGLGSPPITARPGLKQHFRTTLREALWSGLEPADSFWRWLEAYYPQVNITQARLLLEDTLTPLPAVERLKDWRMGADIHLLSNHCQEWLAALLRVIEPYVASVTISNQVGFCKPDPRIFALVEQHCGGANRILYVDDQQKNLVAASARGWHTLQADEVQAWVLEVERRLAVSRQGRSE